MSTAMKLNFSENTSERERETDRQRETETDRDKETEGKEKW